MKQLTNLLVLALLLLAIVALAPAAIDAAVNMGDRQPLTLNLQQQQQLQNQPQIIFVQPDQVQPDQPHQPPPATPTSQTTTHQVQQPTPTVTSNPAQLTAERAAACQAARDAGRRMPGYCVATPAAAAGYGR